MFGNIHIPLQEQHQVKLEDFQPLSYQKRKKCKFSSLLFTSKMSLVDEQSESFEVCEQQPEVNKISKLFNYECVLQKKQPPIQKPKQVAVGKKVSSRKAPKKQQKQKQKKSGKGKTKNIVKNFKSQYLTPKKSISKDIDYQRQIEKHKQNEQKYFSDQLFLTIQSHFK